MSDVPNSTASVPSTMTNKRTMLMVSVLGLILLMIGLIAAVRYFRQSSSSSPTTAITNAVKPLPTEVSVTLGADGFEPKSVSIKTGGAVRWTNTSGGEATVNSDDHPNHQKQKELNLGTFVKGSTLVHIFETPGTYTYHDHFNPGKRGTVVVE